MQDETAGRGIEPATAVETVDPLARTLEGAPGGRRLQKGDAVGRYLILGELGEGGMAVVYKGYDPELDRRVAIKLVTVESVARLEADPSHGGRRLLREAQAMAQLAHPNVVAIYDVGIHGEHGDQVFIAMELVEKGTVSEWLREKRRGWREILDVFRQAGRGLEAAHAVRLVHRDVKPSNMLMGREGRVRVMDFGIVKQEDASEPPLPVAHVAPPLEQPSDPVLASTMTRDGSLLGTVGFMAPEQFDGRPVDARADQFSFCVSLYRALYESPPFDRDAHGAPRGPAKEPKDTRVPAWVTRVVMRGLRLPPEERFPSMTELLAALERDPARQRRLWMTGVAAAVFVLGLLAATAFTVVRSRQRTADLCQGAAERLSGVWDGERKRAVRTAFLAVDKPYARDTYERAEQALNSFAAGWVAMQTESCRATSIRGEQSAELFDLRTACLDMRLDELRAETELFVHADVKVVENAVRAVGALTRLDACANLVSLRAPLPLPVDPAVRAKVADVRRRLADAKALLEAGKYESGIALADPAVAEARTIAYRPLEAESLVQLGWLEVKAGDPKKAEQTLLDGLVAAEAGRDDTQVVSALTELVYVVGYLGARPAEALALSRQGFAVIERMGGSDELRASLDWRLGSAHYAQGKYAEMLEADQAALSLWERLRGPVDAHLAVVMSDAADALGMLGRREEALTTYRKAIAIDEGALGPSHPEVGKILVNVGWVLSIMKRFDEALAADRRAIQILKETVGTSHPNYGYAYNTMGWSELGQGKAGDALASFDVALRVWEKALGEDNPRLADALTGEALARLGQHQPDLALLPIERALAMRQAHSEDALDLAETEFAAARVLRELRREPTRAVELARKAREAYVQAGDHAQINFATLADIDGWLSHGADAP